MCRLQKHIPTSSQLEVPSDKWWSINELERLQTYRTDRYLLPGTLSKPAYAAIRILFSTYGCNAGIKESFSADSLCIYRSKRPTHLEKNIHNTYSQIHFYTYAFSIFAFWNPSFIEFATDFSCTQISPPVTCQDFEMANKITLSSWISGRIYYIFVWSSWGSKGWCSIMVETQWVTLP